MLLLFKNSHEKKNTHMEAINEQVQKFFVHQAKASVGSYKEAEDALLMIQSEKVKADYVYQSWLARWLHHSCVVVVVVFVVVVVGSGGGGGGGGCGGGGGGDGGGQSARHNQEWCSCMK